jgi:hypothetical protein
LYDEGDSGNGWYFYDRRSRYAVRMDPAYHPAIVAQCDIRVCQTRPPEHHDSIYVEIWFDRNGDSIPDFPPVWGSWAQETDSFPDTTAIVVPVPFGQVVCDSGSFWVSMMQDTVNGGAGFEAVEMDACLNYPDHQYYYWPPSGVWQQGSYYGRDWMIRSWTYAPVQGYAVGWIFIPSGQVFVGDSFAPRVRVMNLGTGTFEGWVWTRIEHTCSTDTWLDSAWMQIPAMSIKDTTCRAWAARYPGLYRMQCSSNRNDTNWTYITVLPRAGRNEGRTPFHSALTGIAVEPNPIRSAAVIYYSVASESRVDLRILDARGRVLRTLVSGHSPPGEYSAVWDALDEQGRPVPRGVYFVGLEAGGGRETRKVVLTR